jgi:ComF family protein
MRAWLEAGLGLLFPAVCPVCQARSDDRLHRPFCRACWAALPLLPPPGCRVCGRPLPGLAGDLACDPCRRQPPPFAYARAVAAYRGGMREAIHALKYRGRTAVAPPLAELLAEAGGPLLPEGAPPAVDALIPVPLHPARLAERGFNQAELLAGACARRWERPLLRRALARIRATRPQTELDADDRRRNVAGAFAVVRAREVAGRRILLVDDVLTTGATARDAARALRQAGAAGVGVLTLARVTD